MMSISCCFSGNIVPKPLPRLIAISNRRLLSGGLIETWLEDLGKAGVDGVQIREKDLSDRDLYNLLRRAREILPDSTRILINGRLDLALAPASLRQRFGNAPLIGLSTHKPEEVLAAREAGVDYAMFGPVYPTPLKMRYGPPPGLDGLRQAVDTGLPVFALGGVTINRLPEIADVGAAGAAGIRAFIGTDEVRALAEQAARCFDRTEPN